jgi:hypothetical protein
MPGNDERDPLDNWLHEQVRPLPPPSGTFDLISKRARRRKLRKLAVTVGSAAVVAAGVAIAVPGVTALHIATPSESGNVAAGSSPRTTNGAVKPPATQQPNGTGRPLAPSPSASATGGATGPNPGPVPPDFAPASVTFVSASRAWVIGQAGTPGSCYNGNICTSVAWTSDTGRTWHGEHAPVTGEPAGPDGVSGIRFLDGANGWAFGPELWVTHDGGNDWHAVDTNGRRVTDLETAGDRAYALFAACSGTSPAGFAADCTSYTLMTTTADSDNWVPAGPATTGLSDGGSATSGVLALTGTAGYLVAPDGTLYSGPLGSPWQRTGTMPCRPGTPQANGLPAGAQFAVASSTSLAVACAGLTHTSGAAVYTSGDSGVNWTQVPGGTAATGATASPSVSASASSATTGSDTPGGPPTSLSAAPNGTLVLATATGIYTLAPGGTQWNTSAASGSGSMPPGGFSYVGMTDDDQGVAVPADTSLHEIWLTSDGGRTWSPSPIS